MRPSLVARRLTALDPLADFPNRSGYARRPPERCLGARDLWNLFLSSTPGYLPENNAYHSGEDATGHQCA